MLIRAKSAGCMSRRGTLRDDAMRAYIELVKKLKSEEG
jgi:acyl-CoA-binding protein